MLRECLAFVVLAYGSPRDGTAASFACTKAETQWEKLICATPDLSDADDRTDEVYRAALQRVGARSPIPRSQLRIDQLAWVRLVLANCADVASMSAAYKDRMATLEFAIKPVAPRPGTFEVIEYKAGPRKAFPQVRSHPANLGSERFNYLVRRQLADLADLTKSSSYISHDTQLVGNRVVSTYLSLEMAAPGGAHGYPVRSSIVVDLTTGREVALEDLLLPGAGSMERLAQLAREDLQAQRKSGKWASDANWIDRGVEPKSLLFFTLSTDALVLHFPPYGAGPYSAWDGKAVIPYTKLTDVARPSGLLGTLRK